MPSSQAPRHTVVHIPTERGGCGVSQDACAVPGLGCLWGWSCGWKLLGRVKVSGHSQPEGLMKHLVRSEPGGWEDQSYWGGSSPFGGVPVWV